MNYTIEDLEKYKDIILLKMKLENNNSRVIKSIIKYPSEAYDLWRFLYKDELDLLFNYYKPYLTHLTKKGLLKLLNCSSN